MTEYNKKSMRIGRSILDRLSLGRGKIGVWLGLENDSKGVILNLRNIYYLPNSLCNLMSLELLKDSGIFPDNRNKTLYQLGSESVLAQARQ